MDHQDFLIQPLEEQFLEAVVSVHQSVLGYSLNSRLGKEHLMLLYRTMSKSPDSFVAVALCDSRPIGFVSGTLNIESVKTLFVRSAPLTHWLAIAARLLIHPGLLLNWMRGSEIDKPVFLQGAPVEPILTTIGIDEHFQGHGVGKKLICELEDFFIRNKVSAYRLDTLKSNNNARQFYIALGFLQITERADSVIFVKSLDGKDKRI